MKNACASRWCRRSRIIIKRQWRRFEKHPMRLFGGLTAIITGIFILCIIFAGSSETAYTAFGSYFTALAFVGVIVTVLLQRAELQEQRKELRAQRIELEGQKRELEIQNRTAQLQRFENSFFHLLDKFSNTVKEIQIYKGITDMKRYSNVINCTTISLYQVINREILKSKFSNIKYTIQNIYKSFPTISKKIIYEYYNLIYFIYTHDAFSKNKNEISKYISILSLLLTNSEYALLFYDAIRDDKKINIINELHLFSRYSLLNKSHPPCKPEHILFFSPQAFGEDYEEYIERHGLQGKTLEDFLQ
ncbi:hypothetical protein [uncultured Desulfovibrio sp.]|uniref:hypothetical protein n=1 Tax=uncultured Desulfovibrio sp. TaxID=167968 RepID=UPI00265D4AE7|nr:hypothetical protein [uncultured Desulfovibrio sp.]